MKRIILCFLCITIITLSVSATCTVPVMASTSWCGLSYDEIETKVNAHKDFMTSDGYWYSYGVNGMWQGYLIGASDDVYYTDDELKALLKQSSCPNAVSGEMAVSAVSMALGVVTRNPSQVVTSAYQLADKSKVNGHVTIDENGNWNFDDTAIKELKSQLEKNYYEENNIKTTYKQDTAATAIINHADCYEYEEDFTNDVSSIKDYKYAFTIHLYEAGTGKVKACVTVAFNDDDCRYLYGSPKYDDNGYFAYTKINAVDNDLKYVNLPYKVYTRGDIVNFKVEDIGLYSYYGTDIYSKMAVGFSYYDEKLGVTVTEYQTSAQIYSDYQLEVFEDYQSLFDYVNGEGTFFATKFHEDIKGLQIQANELSQTTVEKLQSIYAAIQEQSANATSQKELQEIIDNAISKKLDDITDNTEETNSKLDQLIDLISKGNETLLDILGVTSEIQSSVENIEIMTAMDLQMHISNNFTKVVDEMKTKFPFSVPWDIYALYTFMAAEPKAPHFEIDYSPLLTNFTSVFGVEVEANEYKFVIDFTEFKVVSETCRGFLSLLFLGYLMSLTRKMFIDGGKT